MKADKGNNVVILDHSKYLRRMNSMLSEGDYTEIIFNALNKMKNAVHEILKKHFDVIGRSTVWKLKISNPQAPRYINLATVGMRLIASNINAPTQKIAKWLIEQFNL